MPEGHSVHRIARQFAAHFVGRRITASSPQGRFAAGAAQLDGHTMVLAQAVGKQLFLEFDHGLWLRVHLGIYGAWDFSGVEHRSTRRDSGGASTVAAIPNGRIGQTNQRGTVVPSTGSGRAASEHEDSLASIGAPRRTRLRMAEQEREETLTDFPPEPIGAVRVRLLTDEACADLRGPTACEVLEADEVQAVIDRLGPDPINDSGRRAEDRFTEVVRRKPTPIALLLMDQSVVSGIGNVYRAEMLFRARLNPHTPGRELPEEVVRALWKDWVKLLKIGVETGQMLTMDGLRGAAKQRALASRADRHWVYHRTGLPCRVCGTSIVMEELGGRKLYWCPGCQA